MNATIPVQRDDAHRRAILGNEPMIFHCHHYNCYLQRVILEAADFEAVPVLIGAAAEVAYSQLKALFAQEKVNGADARKRYAEKVWRILGFGTFDLSPLSVQGGSVSTKNSHYGQGWLGKFGKSKSPVCFFDAGWLAGALSAIYDEPLGAYHVDQPSCIAQGAAENRFELKHGKANYHVYTSVGVGKLTEHVRQNVPASNVDYDGIYNAVSGMDLSGNEEGRIPAFGVYLTRHYANYYNRISFEMLRSMTKAYADEGYDAAADLLTEAGHVCAFNTFGGIMESAEWDALIKPALKTREDWVHGITAVVNAFGWGRWEVTEVGEAGLRFAIQDDYESVGFEAMQGKAKTPVSFLAAGGVSGIANLVYHGDISAKPKLDDELYQRLFRGQNAYAPTAEASRAMGEQASIFKVDRSK